MAECQLKWQIKDWDEQERIRPVLPVARGNLHRHLSQRKVALGPCGPDPPSEDMRRATKRRSSGRCTTFLRRWPLQIMREATCGDDGVNGPGQAKAYPQPPSVERHTEKIEKAACNSEQKADYILDATGNSSRNSCTLVCSESKPRVRRGVPFFGHGLSRIELACILRDHSPSGGNAVPSARPCSV